jgi:cyanobactin maturation PatA/PatG family protease
MYITHLRNLWRISKGEKSLKIAVLDSAVDIQHVAFIDSNVEQVLPNGIISDHSNPSDHGTHVASLIFANHINGEIQGIAPDCSGFIIPVFESDAGGITRNTTQLDLARSIYKAIDIGVKIINISAGELNVSGYPDDQLAKALRTCEQKGILVVAAAGNDGCACLHIPASVDTVLTVGALNENGYPLLQSNYGKEYRSSGILAPGQKIKGAIPNNNYAYKTGTSFAAPIVSGIAALLMSINRSATAKEIRKLFLMTSDKCHDDTEECQRYLTGILNIPRLSKYFFENHTSQLKQSSSLQLSNISNSSILINNKKLNKMNNVTENGILSDQNLNIPLVEKSEILLSGIDDAKISENQNNLEDSILENKQLQPETAHKVTPSEVTLSCGEDKSCGCGGGKPKGPVQLEKVYALGTISYDFVNGSRRDSFLQHITGDINDPKRVIDHLESGKLFEASELIWTLNQEGTPIYAIHPHGPFARDMYQIIIDFLRDQLENGVERVSIPGIIAGNVTLISGQVVPAIAPTIRGMASWSTDALVSSLPKNTKKENITNFLERIYHEFRNFGVTSQDRALNYAATNAFQANSVFQNAIKDGMQLTDISLTKSPIVRPGVDGWDVQLTFFDPSNRFEKAKKLYRYTVDVTDVIPVTIGAVRSWWVY